MPTRRCILAAVALVPLFVTGCSMCSSNEDSAAPIASIAATVVLSPGDRVVVEYARAAFFEGTVSIVGADKLIVVDATTRKAREVDSANVYRLDSSPKTNWASGAVAICRMDDGIWRACRVGQMTGSDVSVLDEVGTEATLRPAAILAPTPVTNVNLKHVFDRVDRASAFAAAVRGAGELYRPDKFKPRKGEEIIIRSGGAYLSATIHEVRRTVILVDVYGPGEKRRAVSPEDVWPRPPVDVPVNAGGYAYMRPASGDNVWKVVRIEDATEGTMKVRTPTGDLLPATDRDLLPIVPRNPGKDWSKR